MKFFTFALALALFSALTYGTATASPARTDLLAAIRYQSSVKSQGSRNLCTVFATLGVIEALYLKDRPNLRDIDLSEEWVQYLVAVHSPSGGGNGSTVATNLQYLKNFGVATEEALPYDSRLWTENSPSLGKERCESLTGLNYTRCLMGHFSPLLIRSSEAELRDPRNPTYDEEFLRGWESARAHKRTLSPYVSGRTVSLNEAKNLLAQGIPLTMEINVYYGAWNTASASAMGIERSERAFALGEVNYPEQGSADRTISPTKTARHAVVIIGYDDSVEMTYEKRMADGTTKTFRRRGVFYFKNSWGTSRFGSSFRVEGKRIPGFGLITQAYAGEFGKFTAIQLASGAEILEK